MNNKKFMDGSIKVSGVVRQKELESQKWRIEVEFFNPKSMEVERKEIRVTMEPEIGTTLDLRYNEETDTLKLRISAVSISWLFFLVSIGSVIIFIMMRCIARIMGTRKRNKKDKVKRSKIKRYKEIDTLKGYKAKNMKLEEDRL